VRPERQCGRESAHFGKVCRLDFLVHSGAAFEGYVKRDFSDRKTRFFSLPFQRPVEYASQVVHGRKMAPRFSIVAFHLGRPSPGRAYGGPAYEPFASSAPLWANCQSRRARLPSTQLLIQRPPLPPGVEPDALEVAKATAGPAPSTGRSLGSRVRGSGRRRQSCAAILVRAA